MSNVVIGDVSAFTMEDPNPTHYPPWIGVTKWFGGGWTLDCAVCDKWAGRPPYNRGCLARFLRQHKRCGLTH